jgi:hypothetical protein
MGRDGGFHPFKGRVSRHFGDSVGLSCCPAKVPRRGKGHMERKRTDEENEARTG